MSNPPFVSPATSREKRLAEALQQTQTLLTDLTPMNLPDMPFVKEVNKQVKINQELLTVQPQKTV